MFALLSVCLMYADNRFDYLDRARYGLGYLVTPVYWVVDIPVRISYWIDDVFVARSDLIEENERLREELLLAQRQLQLNASLTSENRSLRALRSSADVIQGRVLTAEIINVSSDPGTRRVLINKGARDGAFVGQALLDANGLMGQVVEILPFTSWVMLITDPRHGTPVQINRNGERAIARGSRGAAPALELEYVPESSDIKEGDLLVSSGLGQRFPKNYPVATVESVVYDRGQPFATIRARPLAELDRSRHVMLVFEEAQSVTPTAESADAEQFADEPAVETAMPVEPDDPVEAEVSAEPGAPVEREAD